ncbi:RHS repeat protein, partial [Parafrankia sp. FMc2]|uniref:RHS repeat protein n=1 Tax=Parafrankia sp. FMc2 TaxID=3233196 RepID=UPI0034D4BB4E
STAWPSGGWASATSGAFTWTSPGGDTAGFLYGLDEPSPTTSTNATTSASLTADEGLHTFYLRTIDTAGNLSPVVSYNFGVGNAALASPPEQSRTQRFATLRGEAPSSQVSVTYRYRVGTNPSTAWTDVPSAQTTTQGTTTNPTWPAPRNGAGTFDNQIWNIPGTLGGGSDGPIQIQACFRTAAAVVTCTEATTIQLTRNSFSDSNEVSAVGPGSVALLTGDYSLSATDVSMPTYTGSLTIGRTLTTLWVVDRVEELGSNTTSTFTTDAQGRVTRILGPVPDGVDCSGTLGSGCRALTLTYAATTTATGTGGSWSDWGDYTGQLSTISMALNGTTPVEVARYAYDTTGHLRAAWDPRLDTPGGSHLATLSWYDAQGRVQGYIHPGQETWGFNYDGYGRLTTVTRPRPASAGTATIKIAYNVALSGSAAPVDMSPGRVDDWGQQDQPAWATAVFPASHVPSDPPVAADWPYADINYLNANGQGVNRAVYGAGAWQISTTEWGPYGNIIRSLSAENRNQALNPTPDTDPTVAALTDSAARAQLLDTDTIYTGDGIAVTDVYGPKHRYINNNGVRSSARSHVHTDYDQGAPPAADPYWLATTVTTTAFSGSSDTDPRKVEYGYETSPGADSSTSGWNLNTPTSVKTWMGGGSTPDIERRNYFNPTGQPLESRQPKASGTGNDAYTSISQYYSPSGSGVCVNPSWAGLLCRTGPAAQPSTGNPLPTVTYTYNSLNQPATKVETVVVGTATTSRTTAYGYDAAGRKISESISVTPAADGGTAVPARTFAYSSTTGLPTTTTAAGTTLSTTYDTWGQVTSQTDAGGNTTTTSYDADGQVASINDGKGTYSFTYSTSTEHRGLVTGIDIGAGSAPSTLTATYNGDGQISSQTYPNGVVADTRYSNSGSPTNLRYSKGGSTWLTFTQIDNINGQARVLESASGSREHIYDAAGRLGVVRDVRNDTGSLLCTSRRYVYDADYNRTQEISYPDAGTNAPNPTCSTSTTPTYSLGHTYDQADRMTDTGYAYDLFGRATAVPASDAGGTPLTLGYYVNDMVASETQGGTSRTYELDPARRIQSWTQSGTTTVNHYGTASDDSPSWVAKTGGSWVRNILGIGGALVATQDQAGVVTLLLHNLHGDTVATVDNSTSATAPSSFQETQEFGRPYNTSPATSPLGWLGTFQRSHDTVSSIYLMGVRLYNPNTGRFLQVDPIVGGNENPYEYASQDPYNKVDLTGRYNFYFRTQYGPAGNVDIHGTCNNVCSVSWHVNFTGIYRSASIKLYYRYYINGKFVVQNHYGHTERGDYPFHATLGARKVKDGKVTNEFGYYNYGSGKKGWIRPGTRLRFEFFGNMYLRGRQASWSAAGGGTIY